jgi:hypothetical protein
LLTALEDYFLIRGQWYRGSKESFVWLKNNQPKLFAKYEKAIESDAKIEALADLVEEMDRDFS